MAVGYAPSALNPPYGLILKTLADQAMHAIEPHGDTVIG